MDKKDFILIGFIFFFISTFYSYNFLLEEAALNKCRTLGYYEIIVFRDSKYCKLGDTLLGVGCSGEIWNIRCGVGTQTQSLNEVSGD